jgi:hypothetical protein
VGYNEPEECTVPLAMELPWNPLEIPFNLYASKELFEIGAGNAYYMYRRYLQLLTWQSLDRSSSDFTWMLKAPTHVPYIQELGQAFPEATIIWAHRNPIEWIASACALYDTVMQVVMIPESIDRNALGRAVVEYTANSIERAFRSIDTNGEGRLNARVIHVSYSSLIRCPKQVCKEMLEQARLPFTSTYEVDIDKYLQKFTDKIRYTQNTHLKYHLRDYGLSEEMIHTRFASYVNRYQELTNTLPSATHTSIPPAIVEINRSLGDGNNGDGNNGDVEADNFRSSSISVQAYTTLSVNLNNDYNRMFSSGSNSDVNVDANDNKQNNPSVTTADNSFDNSHQSAIPAIPDKPVSPLLSTRNSAVTSASENNNVSASIQNISDVQQSNVVHKTSKQQSDSWDLSSDPLRVAVLVVAANVLFMICLAFDLFKYVSSSPGIIFI